MVDIHFNSRNEGEHLQETIIFMVRKNQNTMKMMVFMVRNHHFPGRSSIFSEEKHRPLISSTFHNRGQDDKGHPAGEP